MKLLDNLAVNLSHSSRDLFFVSLVCKEWNDNSKNSTLYKKFVVAYDPKFYNSIDEGKTFPNWRCFWKAIKIKNKTEALLKNQGETIAYFSSENEKIEAIISRQEEIIVNMFFYLTEAVPFFLCAITK